MKSDRMMGRRGFLGAAALPLIAKPCRQEPPPIHAVTRGPKFHWFGYYDKLQFDPTGRYALCNEVDFEHRSPGPGDAIKVGMVDLEDGDRWIELGESRAWNWQQGCMLQWIPGSRTEVIWNDREGGRFVSRVLDVRTRRLRTLPGPIYALSPDGRWSVAPDFRRLHDTRPGYGYAGPADPNRGLPAPEDAGIWKMDLAGGEARLIVTFADALKVPPPQADWAGAKHWYNHLLFNTDGSRFCFLHRWAPPNRTGAFKTRLITASPEGKDLHLLDPNGWTSHFIWRDPSHILAWAWHPSHKNRFYLFEDRTDRVEVVGPDVMTVNGHCSYLPGNRWILNDTYPDKERMQHLYLYHVESGMRVPLGRFLLPREYSGEWRCDLHPRFGPAGRKVTIDSPHGGDGRQMYLIDIGGIVG